MTMESFPPVPEQLKSALIEATELVLTSGGGFLVPQNVRTGYYERRAWPIRAWRKLRGQPIDDWVPPLLERVPVIAQVYCTGQGRLPGHPCRRLVNIGAEPRLCADCKTRTSNCVVCGAGCNWWATEERCLYGHPSRRQSYATETDLLRERLSYYQNQGRGTWRAEEEITKTETRLREMAQ